MKTTIYEEVHYRLYPNPASQPWSYGYQDDGVHAHHYAEDVLCLRATQADQLKLRRETDW